MQLYSTCLVLLPLFASCAATPVSTPSAPEDSVPIDALRASVMEATAPREPVALQHRVLGEDELAIWQDPVFKRAFAESYLSETDIEPTVTTTERDVLIEVRDAIANNDVEKAKALLAENGGPAASATFDFTLGNLNFQGDELEAALVNYSVATGKFPKFRRAWKNMALVAVRSGDFAAAGKSFTRVIELGGGDALTYGLLGFAYISQANNLAAESAYRMAILLDPETDDWKMGLARSLFKQSRFAEAVSLTGSMLAVAPDQADLWMLQANAFLGNEDATSAAENFEFVDRLGASTTESLNLLGDIYINAELYDMAESAYARALHLDAEGDRERALVAAKNLAARGALDETAAMLDRLDETFGDSLGVEDQKTILRLRARLAVAAGTSDEEAEILEEIVALDPLDGAALILLGQHEHLIGNNEQAIFYFERASAIEDFEADAKVRHAQLLVAMGKYDEALPLLRRAQTLQPRESIQQYLDQVERVAKGR